MTEPDAYLLEQYGTGELTKEGSFPLAAKIALMVLGVKAMEADKGSAQAEQTQEHEEMRAQEAELMAPVHDSLKHGSAEYQARYAGRGMAKVAIGAPIFKAVSSVLGEGAKATGKGALMVARNPKVQAGVLAAGGLYGTYKGVSKLRDYRSGPQGSQRWGSGQPLRMSVSRHGY
jgi:hypothetical protein